MTLRHAGAAAFRPDTRLPGLAGASGWLNSPPLADEDLRGKVVLADFWTYTCINWLRTLAYVRAWAERYEEHGLVIVGVHTPEFPFEREVENVRWAARELEVPYPIAIDSDYAIWNAFANRYWPAVYIADAEGRIRHRQFGEGSYEECESVIQRLLRDSGRSSVPGDAVEVAPDGLEAQADWRNLRSPETYLTEPHADAPADRLRLNQWSLAGDWSVATRAAVLNRRGGAIAYRFHARDVHLVMRPMSRDASVPFRVLLDGRPPGPDHGLDVDANGNGTVRRPRLYGLIRRRGPVTEGTLEITFDAEVEAYVFTFG